VLFGLTMASWYLTGAALRLGMNEGFTVLVVSALFIAAVVGLAKAAWDAWDWWRR
jgi:hypothetical protein